MANEKEVIHMQDKMEEVLNNWGMMAECRQIYGSAWAVGEDYILKTY
jgi:hypothetical protein